MADTKMQTSPEIAIKAKTGNPSAKAGIKVKGTTLGELRQDLGRYTHRGEDDTRGDHGKKKAVKI